jgi:hypothetical protein
MLRLGLVGCVVALVLTVASPALAGTREKILQECQDGRLSGDYTAKEIRDARNNIPTDIDQYSDCRDVLGRALNDRSGGGAGGGGGGGTGGGGASGGGELLTPASPADQKAITRAQQDGDTPVSVGGAPLTPGAAGFHAGAPRTPVPAEIIVVLALLALAALAGIAPFLRRRLGSAGALATLPKRVFARGR